MDSKKLLLNNLSLSPFSLADRVYKIMVNKSICIHVFGFSFTLVSIPEPGTSIKKSAVSSSNKAFLSDTGKLFTIFVNIFEN